MIQVVAETHCHTVACDHAYSTLYENVQAAARKGHRFICITEHGPRMVDGPQEWFFGNIGKVVPDVIDGVIVLKGAEANIMDYSGTLDISDSFLACLDWVIASYHTVCVEPASVNEHTQGWLAVAKNPLVDVIGHCGDNRYQFDYDAVIQEFSKNGKIVEINSHSFHCRPGSLGNCREIALLCKKYGVPVVCSSDAHFFTQIGEVQESIDMLREIDYPQELILNTDYERFLAVAREKSGRKLV
ncbi:phosphatase [Oscillospiraceae bacterium PP1C4]